MTNGISSWMKPLYLYLVSIISLIVFIIGSVTIVNLLIREYIFDVHGSWYEDPAEECEYILTGGGMDFERRTRAPVPEAVSTDILEDMTKEEREATYEKCVKDSEAKLDSRNQYNFADDMSRGIAMILISIPIFLWHWRIIKKDK